MDKTLKVTFIVGLFVSLVFLYGFRCLSRAIKSTNHKMVVTSEGFAEKTVKSDIVEVKIAIKNKDEDFSKLYQKRMGDKQKVLDFLKSCGLDEKDVISVVAKTENRGEREGAWGITKISHKEQAFASEDTINIRTSNFDSIEKMKDNIMQLASKEIIVSYTYDYKLLNLDNLREELLAASVKNAEKNAQVLISQFGKRIKKVAEIRMTSNVDIMNETANSSWSWGESAGTDSSLMKKAKMRVTADFYYE